MGLSRPSPGTKHSNHGRAIAARQGRLRQRGHLRPLRHGQLQPDQRPPDGPASDEPVRRLARLLQQLLLGGHGRRHPHRLRHQHDRQPTPGLDQLALYPDVGLEPLRDARRDELGALPASGQGEGRPHRLRRSAYDAKCRGPGRRMDPHPARHGRRHAFGHGPRHHRRRARRQGLRRDALPRVRRGPDAGRPGERRKLQGLHPRNARRDGQDARLGRENLRHPARDDCPASPRVRQDQAGHALPRLRPAAAGLRRAGRPGRMRPGRDHGQHRHPGRLGRRAGPAGARRRPALERLPRPARTRSKPRSRPFSGPRPSPAARR